MRADLHGACNPAGRVGGHSDDPDGDRSRASEERPWITNDGYEYNAVLIAAGLVLAEIGPGPISLDAVLGDRLHGTWWAIAAAITGATGAASLHRYSQPLAADVRPSADSGVMPTPTLSVA